MVRDFQEIQYLAWWAALILIGSGILIPILFLTLSRFLARRTRVRDSAVSQKLVTGVLIGGAVFAGGLSAWIFLSFGVMTTDVTPSDVRVQFGWLPGYKETIPISAIRSANAIRYNPIEYGGWGLKARSANDRVLSQRGDRGVRLQLRGGGQLLIGSQEPEALAKAIEQFRPPAQARP